MSNHPFFRGLLMLSLLLLVVAACEGEPASEEANDEAEDPAEPTDDPEDEPEDTEGPDEDADPGGDDEAADDEAEQAEGNPEGCLDEEPDGEVFAEQAGFVHADTVDVTYEDTHKLVEIDAPSLESPVEFALVQCGVDAPDLEDDVRQIEVPVESAVTVTTTNIPHFDALDAVDRLEGVGVPDLVTTPAVQDAIEAGDVEGYADAEGSPEVERVIEAEPDVLVLDGFGDAVLDEVDRLGEAGVPALVNTDFDETTLLGRAEWVKVTGMLLNREAEAAAVFDDVEAGYEEVRETVADAEEQPRVLADEPFEGTWFAAGGESFLADGIADAGGEYVFADEESTGSLEYDIEVVLDEGADADVWIQAGSVDGSLDDLLAVDERFAEIDAFQDGEVWASDAGATEAGGMPRFESAYLHADTFLADLAAIFHPDLVDHDPVYFGRVEE